MSSATPSEDSQDREFVISDSESLSLRCDSPSETMAVHFPVRNGCDASPQWMASRSLFPISDSALNL